MIKIFTTTVLFIICATKLPAQCWQNIYAGSSANHSMGIKADGTLYAWGENDNGEVGDNTTTEKPSPVSISTSTDWKAIAVNGNHTLALKNNGELWAWGYNGWGALGDGTTNNQTQPIRIGTQTDWDTIAAGQGSSHAIKTDGTLWAWGYNGYNAVGIQGAVYYNTPTLVNSHTNWKAVSVGNHSGIALKTDGTIWQWGNGYYFGAPAVTPIQIGADNDWKMVSHGSEHTLALKNNGTLWAWGNNLTGQLGDGTIGGSYSGLPKQIGTDNDWLYISAGGAASFAIKTDGSLWGWGSNSYGQQGDGTNIGKTVPTRIGTSTDWKSVSAGPYHTFALKNDGSLWAAGLNDRGQLGVGNTTNSNTFALVDCNSAMPVSFGVIHAVINNNKLQVDWETLNESNNSHFEIEVSKNGRTFYKVGTVTSKAAGGISNSPLNYNFELDLTSASYLAISLLPLTFLFCYSNRKRNKLLFITTFLLIAFISCQKNSKSVVVNTKYIFVQIKQVDKDGSFKTSPVITVTY